MDGDFGSGLFHGALLCAAAYHASVYVSLRERAWLGFAVFVALLSLSTWVWETQAGARGASLGTLADAACAGAALAFARDFLATRAHAPRLDGVLRALLGLALASALFAAPPTLVVGMGLGDVLSVAGCAALVTVGGICWRRGVPEATAYLLATTAVLLGIVVEVGATWIVEPAPRWTEAGTYVGALLLVVVISRALTDRQRRILAERGRLEAESLRDELTGLSNRRHFERVLADEWRRASREEEPLSLILADVDHFKAYNDHYGHRAGDDCLRGVAQALASAAVRPGDLVARYGGEELAAILPGVDGDGARAVAEAMARAVRELARPHAGSPVADHVTVSLGVAEAAADARLKPDLLVEDADRALYAAKKAGRDRAHGP